MAKLYPVVLVIKLAVFCFVFSLAVYVVLTSARAEATPLPTHIFAITAATDFQVSDVRQQRNPVQQIFEPRLSTHLVAF